MLRSICVLVGENLDEATCQELTRDLQLSFDSVECEKTLYDLGTLFVITTDLVDVHVPLVRQIFEDRGLIGNQMIDNQNLTTM